MRQNSSFLRRIQNLAVLLALSTSLTGCSWLKSLNPTQSEGTFPGWSESMSSSARGADDKKGAKPSGLLFDERSKQIEKNLGGNF
ncbi:MAG: hypothetical protein K8R36_07185 [Planctomycetales bacterium]|nr:hypothetical protein [Planctomycetales bacterium]